MAINQTPGEIYFIRERDLLSHEFSNYVKVGLVRDNEGRSSEERLLEHQTGNPRLLSLFKVIKTPAVAAIEGVIHGLFAAHRVSGEWFDFDKESLERCVLTTQKLSEEAQANIKIIAEAARLKEVASTSEVKKPTPEIEDYFTEYLDATFCLAECKRRDKILKELFIKAEENQEDVQHLIEKQERRGRSTLDKEALAAAHPEIFAKYIYAETSVSGRVNFAKSQNSQISMALLGPDIDEFMFELHEAIEKVESGIKSVDSLQDYSLRLTEFTTAAEWHQEIAMANIKAFCGDAAEVEGILKWQRTSITKELFNEKLFKEELPELFSEFSTIAEDVVAHKLKMTKANPKTDGTES